MSEKMRDYQWQQAGWIASWMKRHAINLDAEPFAELQDHLAALRTHENVGQESGSVQDAVDKFSALLADCTESERQQARAIFCEVLGVGGQESEAGAVAEVVDNKPYWISDAMPVFLPNGTKLYPAPPSAQAIETAAIMKCVEAVRNTYAKSTQSPDESGTLMDAALAVEAIITQDGRTQLEELLSKFAEALLIEINGNYGTAHVSDGPLWHVIVKRAIRAIVTNLIEATK